MENSLIGILLLDKLRSCIKYIKRNLYTSISIFLVLIFSISSIGPLLENYLLEYLNIISSAFLIYCIAKLFQDLPTINIDYRLLELSILKLWSLKLLILLKSSALSIILIIICLKFNIFNETTCNTIIILFTINIVINLVCFLKSQTKLKTVLVCITTFIVGLSYYFDSVLLIFSFLLIILIYLLSRKFIKYDEILSFYKSMLIMKQGLISNNSTTMISAKNSLSKTTINSSISLLEKFYDSNINFEFYKEISRILCNYKKLVTLLLINSFIVLLTIKHYNIPLINSISFLVMLFISEQILTSLNSEEKMIIENGFYYPFSLNTIIQKRYFSHLLIILIPLIPSIFLITKISCISIIMCVLIIPVKNLLSIYKTKLWHKYLFYTLDLTLFALCFINNLF